MGSAMNPFEPGSIPRSLVVLALACLAACTRPPDPRIATPQDTVETLLRAYHLWGATSPGAARRSWSGRQGDLPPSPDMAAVALCFWDYDRDDPRLRAMGRFVTGMLAAGQGSLLFDVRGGNAVVRSGHRPVYFRRTSQGWHIVLQESVPAEIREGLPGGQRRLGHGQKRLFR